MTEDQRLQRRRARSETTKCRRAIHQAECWHHLNTNRERFWISVAGGHAKQAARHAFKAHPELRASLPTMEET